MTDVEAQRFMRGIIGYIQSRKMPEGDSVLVPEAAAGFNLACDFLAHQLGELVKSHRDLLKGIEQEK
jgi:hypothetical protein